MSKTSTGFTGSLEDFCNIIDPVVKKAKPTSIVFCILEIQHGMLLTFCSGIFFIE